MIVERMPGSFSCFCLPKRNSNKLELLSMQQQSGHFVWCCTRIQTVQRLQSALPARDGGGPHIPHEQVPWCRCMYAHLYDSTRSMHQTDHWELTKAAVPQGGNMFETVSVMTIQQKRRVKAGWFIHGLSVKVDAPQVFSQE